MSDRPLLILGEPLPEGYYINADGFIATDRKPDPCDAHAFIGKAPGNQEREKRETLERITGSI